MGIMLTWFGPVLTMKRLKPPHTDTNTHLPNDPLNFKAQRFDSSLHNFRQPGLAMQKFAAHKTTGRLHPQAHGHYSYS